MAQLTPPPWSYPLLTAARTLGLDGLSVHRRSHVYGPAGIIIALDNNHSVLTPTTAPARLAFLRAAYGSPRYAPLTGVLWLQRNPHKQSSGRIYGGNRVDMMYDGFDTQATNVDYVAHLHTALSNFLEAIPWFSDSERARRRREWEQQLLQAQIHTRIENTRTQYAS